MWNTHVIPVSALKHPQYCSLLPPPYRQQLARCTGTMDRNCTCVGFVKVLVKLRGSRMVRRWSFWENTEQSWHLGTRLRGDPQLLPAGFSLHMSETVIVISLRQAAQGRSGRAEGGGQWAPALEDSSSRRARGWLCWDVACRWGWACGSACLLWLLLGGAGEWGLGTQGDRRAVKRL